MGQSLVAVCHFGSSLILLSTASHGLAVGGEHGSGDRGGLPPASTAVGGAGGRDTSGLLRGVALPSTGAPAGSGEGARKGQAVGGSTGAYKVYPKAPENRYTTATVSSGKFF